MHTRFYFWRRYEQRHDLLLSIASRHSLFKAICDEVWYSGVDTGSDTLLANVPECLIPHGKRSGDEIRWVAGMVSVRPPSGTTAVGKRNSLVTI
jgi:hypothetical protein